MPVIMRISHAPEKSWEHRGDLAAPMVMREISEYKSPIDGRLISSRGERNEDCKRNDAIPWEPGIGKKAGADKRTPGKYKNSKFAAKRGLPLNEEAREKAYRTRKENA